MLTLNATGATMIVTVTLTAPEIGIATGTASVIGMVDEMITHGRGTMKTIRTMTLAPREDTENVHGRAFHR